jgi:NAD(P)-dependent dehydrogenase (short-subunit alcohol dehydrogenase family)
VSDGPEVALNWPFPYRIKPLCFIRIGNICEHLNGCRLTRRIRLLQIAGAVVFLALPASSYITGHTLHADGGLLANGFSGPCTD